MSLDALTLANGWSQRTATYRFELLSSSLDLLGTMEIDDTRPPTVNNNTNRTIKRQLDGLYISPSDASEVNPLTDRVRVIMNVAGLLEYEMGVFLFTSFQREGTGTVWRNATLLDQLVMFDQPMAVGWGVAPGTRIDYALDLWFKQAGVPWYEIEPQGDVIRGSEWLVWPSGTSGIDPLYDLCELAGCYSGYFDNHGMGVVRSVPDIDAVDPVLIYDDTMVQSSLTVTNDLLDLPNRYIVISNSADYPVDGYWDVPASAPHSKENRGRVIAKTKDVQGVTDHAQAVKIAKAWGMSDTTTYEWNNFVIAADPRLDTFDIVGLSNQSHHVQSWSHRCKSGTDMDIEARRIYRGEAA